MVYLVVPSLYFFGKKHLGPSSVSIINDNIRLLCQCSRKAISLAASKTHLGIPTQKTNFGVHHNGTIALEALSPGDLSWPQPKKRSYSKAIFSTYRANN